jgi:RNA polymerase-binding transcription factor DksA
MKRNTAPGNADLSPVDAALIRRNLLQMRSELACSPGDRNRMRLKQVETALDRMARGRYGLCDSCAQAVHKNRLLAMPYVRYCVTCSGGDARPGRDAASRSAAEALFSAAWPPSEPSEDA